jgi:hypothetical protein
MERKKLRLILSLVVILFGIAGCTTFSTANSNAWLEYEIPPSEVKFTGEIFMRVKLSDGSICSVFQDIDLIPDAYFYKGILMQDFGWRKSGDNWVGNGYSRDYKLGGMYINPRRQVAIYFDPEGDFGIFRANIKGNSNLN